MYKQKVLFGISLSLWALQAYKIMVPNLWYHWTLIAFLKDLSSNIYIGGYNFKHMNWVDESGKQFILHDLLPEQENHIPYFDDRDWWDILIILSQSIIEAHM
jgi:hypothetical protein